MTSENSYDSDALLIAAWLAGADAAPLPTVPQSYRWGFIHWWRQVSSETYAPTEFVQFWEQWPHSFHRMIETEIEFNLEHAVVRQADLRVKDVLSKLFFNSIHLPDRNFRSNIILNVVA